MQGKYPQGNFIPTSQQPAQPGRPVPGCNSQSSYTAYDLTDARESHTTQKNFEQGFINPAVLTLSSFDHRPHVPLTPNPPSDYGQSSARQFQPYGQGAHQGQSHGNQALLDGSLFVPQSPAQYGSPSAGMQLPSYQQFNHPSLIQNAVRDLLQS